MSQNVTTAAREIRPGSSWGRFLTVMQRRPGVPRASAAVLDLGLDPRAERLGHVHRLDADSEW